MPYASYSRTQSNIISGDITPNAPSKMPNKVVPWKKDYIIYILQETLQSIIDRAETSTELNTFQKILDQYCKVRGFYVKEQESDEDGIIVVSECESLALWEETLQRKQSDAFAKAKDHISSDTGTTVASSPDES